MALAAGATRKNGNRRRRIANTSHGKPPLLVGLAHDADDGIILIFFIVVIVRVVRVVIVIVPMGVSTGRGQL